MIFVCSNHGVLKVRTGVAFEGKRFREIEGDDFVFSELDHEVAQCTSRDGLG